MVGSAEDLVTASAITYLVIVGFVWLDAWFPVVPGETLGTRAAGKLFRTDKSRGRLAWAEDQLERRRWIILVSRFVAGGRTAVMFASGTFQMEWRTRFLPFQVAAALLWTGAMALSATSSARPSRTASGSRCSPRSRSPRPSPGSPSLSSGGGQVMLATAPSRESPPAIPLATVSPRAGNG